MGSCRSTRKENKEDRRWGWYPHQLLSLLKQLDNGETEYLIRWEDYGPEDDTWSTHNELTDLFATNFEPALEVYLDAQKKKKKVNRQASKASSSASPTQLLKWEEAQRVAKLASTENFLREKEKVKEEEAKRSTTALFAR